ncbi:duf4419 domain-containing protein [Curvularia clavata]|uniref:Duf4419 domain-containing protein n=1 Tax=Curvularia clavata TaxID=95742 RepID=A0A9Q8ZC11_CURCL|nr:duf4419 domain-containing protein [Curvularia clavata]
MHVTLKVADHGSKAFRYMKATLIQALLEGTSPSSARFSKGIIQSSFSKHAFENSHLVPSSNGFVKAALNAYNHHHHLTIRPDDVWFAILSQLSFSNAEALRDHFVSHQGQKELRVKEVGTIQSVDMGALARRMTALI